MTLLPPIDYPARLAAAAALLDGGALLLLSQPEAFRNSSVEHSWRQESFFYYLTGFSEPDAALLLTPYRPVGQQVHLFLREKDPGMERWSGKRLGVRDAVSSLPIDLAYPIGSLWQQLPDLLDQAAHVAYHFGLKEDYDRSFIAALGQQRQRHGKRRLSCQLPVVDAMGLAGSLRLHKGPDEVARLRAAAGVTRRTFAKIHQTLRPGLSEKDIYSLILGEFTAHGDREAYGSIVAAGANACCLHYQGHTAPLRDGELLLVDAGAEFESYASDVTRTMPIGRRFTPEQRAVYDVVLAAQKATIATAVVGSSLEHLHTTAVAHLVDGLLELGLLRGAKADIIAKGLYGRFYPHGTSHWIGMDVHDVGPYFRGGKPLPLAPGMYFSVEPGLYIDPDDQTVPAAFRGIGIRIEDDVLVTAAGPEVLTAGIEKEPGALEQRF